MNDMYNKYILINYMLFIYLPDCSNKYWFHPFWLFQQSLFAILQKNSIECQILTKLPSDYDMTDIYIVFQIRYTAAIRSPVILINSESVYIRKDVNYLKHNNIKLILEYEYKNINKLKTLSDIPLKYVPFTYSKFIETHFTNNTINNNDGVNHCSKDIDFLLFGSSGGKRRMQIKNDLQSKSNGCYDLCFYGTSDYNELYKMINRTKIVLVIHYYEVDRPIDFYRINLLLCNKVFFIHESVHEDDVNNKYNEIIFSDYDTLVDDCLKYIQMTDTERLDISTKQYEWWKTSHQLEKYIPFDEIKKLIQT